MENKNSSKSPIQIIHFNDVYEVRGDSNKEVCGGADRFCSLVKSFKEKNPLVLFSGDLWNPSKLSAIFKGEHLVDVINTIGLDAAALGNHDLVILSTYS
jgi:5'-nucleotidase